MKAVSIGEMIGSKLGKQAQEDYNRVRNRDDRSILKFGIKTGMRIGKSVVGEELPDDYLEEIYKRWLEVNR